MYPEQFLVDDPMDPMTRGRIDLDLVNAVLTNSDIGCSDVEAASALLRLARDELESYGTDGMERTNGGEIQLMLRASKAVLGRLGIKLDLRSATTRGFARTGWRTTATGAGRRAATSS